ncbi:ABC transporter ATP-binding protein [Bacillaceae bacterium SIJ1]|uniref:ABC transporter ATP-binding protein n=1 Tax=Litoribacterium kuwaitense TaxID=1398745 RepID=UPI0013E9B622|nr:ABC transporter ATP-binding protein [Litoribacterium kuwaitense]NGP45415.1 ABC transporter ATP-binding protein [Litoribacterium kuwaitense]
MQTGKRLYQYALTSKKRILLGLLLLVVAVGAELSGPLIAKTIIDRHIVGVEEPWYSTTEQPNAVEYKGTWVIRESYADDANSLEPAGQVAQIGTTFYWTEEVLPQYGERSFDNGVMRVSSEEIEFTTQASPLSGSEILAFYQPEVAKIIGWLSFYLGLIIVATFFQYGQNYFLKVSANRIIQRMRIDVFSHLSRLPVRFFDNLPAGKIVSRVTNDTEAIRELYVAVLSNFFTSGIYMLGIYTAMFFLDARLAAFSLLLIPVMVVWMVVYRKLTSKHNHDIRSKISEINANMNENIQGMSMIQAFRREQDRMEQFEEMNESYMQSQKKLLLIDSLTSHNLTWVLRNIVVAMIIWFAAGGAAGTIGSIITLGTLYAFVDYVTRLFEPLNNIVNQLNNLEQARVSGERVFKLMDERGFDVADDKIQRLTGDVEFANVTFGYKENEAVLKNITFHAKPGETIALVGHTGSGKSSLMNLLFRFYDAQEGRILMDGQDIRDLSPQALRSHMAIVLQDPYLFTGTIGSNIAMENEEMPREDIEQALRAVGGAEMFKQFEKGIDEPVREKGSTLSSGQRQLISFARALAIDPAILVLDEATSNIDTETEAMIQRGLDVLKKGRTTFIIAHRLSTIRDADQILVLDAGRIVERGTHEQLMALGGSYAQMYRLQKQKNAG